VSGSKSCAAANVGKSLPARPASASAARPASCAAKIDCPSARSRVEARCVDDRVTVINLVRHPDRERTMDATRSSIKPAELHEFRTTNCGGWSVAARAWRNAAAVAISPKAWGSSTSFSNSRARCCCGLRNARREVGTATSHHASPRVAAGRGSRSIRSRWSARSTAARTRACSGRRVADHRRRLPASGLEGARVWADECPAAPAAPGCLSPPTSPADLPTRVGSRRGGGGVRSPLFCSFSPRCLDPLLTSLSRRPLTFFRFSQVFRQLPRDCRSLL
jgi:hypothetical protein